MDAETAKTLGELGPVVLLILVLLGGIPVLWRFVNIQGNLVGALTSSAQAANKTADAANKNADTAKTLSEEMRRMREGQAQIANVLSNVDTNVEGLKDQGVRTATTITATFDDLQRFQKQIVPKMESMLSAFERHEENASHRHKAILNELTTNHKYIITDLDEFDNLLKGAINTFNEIRTELSTISAKQSKIIEFVRTVDTGELLSADKTPASDAELSA